MISHKSKIIKSVWNKNEACKAIKRSPKVLTDSDCDPLLGEMKGIDKIEYEKTKFYDRRE